MNFQFLLSCFYFFLPAYFANMTPTLIAKAGVFNFLAKPVDLGRKFKGSPIFGSHKTWRGVIFGTIAGILIVWFQVWLYRFPSIKAISFFDYTNINFRVGGWWLGSSLFGFLISSGAIFGDLFFAFIKRRLKLEPGARFLPFDQINYVIGAALFVTPFFKIESIVWITTTILTFFLHIISNWIGFKLSLRETKW